jgi:hypothetical protein
MTIFTFPVVLGGGKTLFAGGSAPRAYRLTRSRVSSTGVMIGHYERDGEIKIGDTALNSPSTAEAARQERSDDDRESETPNEGSAIPRVRRPRRPAL